jgi:hypothetical protein
LEKIEHARERLPNRAKLVGNIEAIQAPYQRPDADTDPWDS